MCIMLVQTVQITTVKHAMTLYVCFLVDHIHMNLLCLPLSFGCLWNIKFFNPSALHSSLILSQTFRVQKCYEIMGLVHVTLILVSYVKVQTYCLKLFVLNLYRYFFFKE